jgi:hypothetical protein
MAVTLVTALALAGCSDGVKGEKGDVGEKGEPGPGDKLVDEFPQD